MCEVYPPSEDTFLLLEALEEENLKNRHCLEIGVGSGIITEFFAKNNVVDGVDINPKAIEITQGRCKTCNIFYSDLFSNIKKKYDIIVFNPPYVSEERKFDDIFDRSWYGGKDGRMVIDRFLEEFDNFLNLDGKMYLLHSSLCNLKKTLRMLEEKGFKTEILKSKKLFFEELTVIKSERDSNSNEGD
ncbi:MAG: methyltransferase [Methanomicrobia archaeon]|nr:methyltransferase [Methanomicrobia archaeon]